MTLEELINRINYHRRKQSLSEIWINSRPSSLGGGKMTLEIRSGDEVLAKSTNGGALNWLLKGMLLGYKDKALPSITGNFNSQLNAITRSNYSRVVEEE